MAVLHFAWGYCLICDANHRNRCCRSCVRRPPNSFIFRRSMRIGRPERLRLFLSPYFRLCTSSTSGITTAPQCRCPQLDRSPTSYLTRPSFVLSHFSRRFSVSAVCSIPPQVRALGVAVRNFNPSEFPIVFPTMCFTPGHVERERRLMECEPVFGQNPGRITSPGSGCDPLHVRDF